MELMLIDLACEARVLPHPAECLAKCRHTGVAAGARSKKASSSMLGSLPPHTPSKSTGQLIEDTATLSRRGMSCKRTLAGWRQWHDRPLAGKEGMMVMNASSYINLYRERHEVQGAGSCQHCPPCLLLLGFRRAVCNSLLDPHKVDGPTEEGYHGDRHIGEDGGPGAAVPL